MKKRLQDFVKSKVQSFPECCKDLGWEIKDDGEFFFVKCNCENSKIYYGGFFSTEVVECENCGKRVIDLFSPIQTGNSTGVLLNPSDFEIEKDENGNDRYWTISSNENY